MIRIDSNADGTARVDGWLAPPRRCQVEVALISSFTLAVAADADSRFAFPAVPRGTVRIVVRPPERDGAAGWGRAGAAEAEVGDNPGARPVTGLVEHRLVTTAEQRASRAHRRGMLAGNAGHPAVGARLVRTGLSALGWQEEGGVPGRHGALAARMLITLAYLEAEQGRAGYGLRLLSLAEPAVGAADRGHLHSQRGLMLLRTGRWADALGQLTLAEPLASGDPELQARVLLNRSVLYLNTGDVRLARGDLRRSASIASAAGLTLLAAKATQNLGYCDLLRGDIPAALHQFDVAARAYEATAPGMLPVLATDRARALLAAGLADDAAAALDGVIAAFRRQRLDQNLGEAELNRAQAARRRATRRPPGGGRGWRCAASRPGITTRGRSWPS